MNHKLKIKLSCTALTMLFCAQLFAQEQKPGYIAPFDFKMYSSGNFAEIRPNHFHAGFDIKTGGTTGKPVRAASDGYVSRIAVSPSGYGKALYITHPHLGTTTVYAHLNDFNGAIDKYVKDEQYRRRSFPLDIYLEKGALPVKQGDTVAFSGNTGSSGGPHLHYEVRESSTQDALGVITGGYLTGVDDTIEPRFVNLYTIAVDTVKGIPVHTVTGHYPLTKTDGTYSPGMAKIPVADRGYFAVEVTDSKDGSANTMGIYSLEQEIDGVKNFGFKLDRIPFATTRYINSIIHYPLHRNARYGVLRTYRTPNNPLNIYNGVDNGVISFTDTLTHHVEIRITDDSRHTSRLLFDIVKKEHNAPVAEGIPVDWSQEKIITLPGMKLTIPGGALYESVLLNTDIKEKPEGAYSPVYVLHDDNTLLQDFMRLSIVPEGFMRSQADKLCIVSRARPGARPVYEGGRYLNGAIEVRTRSFGEYWVVMDSIPPTITPNFTEGADMTGRRSISVIIQETLCMIFDSFFSAKSFK